MFHRSLYIVELGLGFIRKMKHKILQILQGGTSLKNIYFFHYKVLVHYPSRLVRKEKVVRLIANKEPFKLP